MISDKTAFAAMRVGLIIMAAATAQLFAGIPLWGPWDFWSRSTVVYLAIFVPLFLVSTSLFDTLTRRSDELERLKQDA